VSQRSIASKDYVPQYPNPLTVRAGDVVHVGARDDEFPEWWWCRSSEGLEGWMPTDILERLATNSARVREDYSAKEIPIAAGDHLTIERSLGGWSLVRNQRGEQGWVPDTCYR